MRGYIEVVRHLHAVRTGKNPCNKILIGCRSHGGSRWLQWNRGTRDDCEQQHAHSQSRPDSRMLPAFHQDVPSIHYSLLFVSQQFEQRLRCANLDINSATIERKMDWIGMMLTHDSFFS